MIKDVLSQLVGTAFKEAGYDQLKGQVNDSDRPDLCDFQCNDALSGAKIYRKAPLMIASEVVSLIEKQENPLIKEIQAVAPGFINITLVTPGWSDAINDMRKTVNTHDHIQSKKVIIDFGGANVAKSLHVGHLRSAVIGESIKRLYRHIGYQVVGDIHMGDWGLQMGYVIVMLKEQQPDLCYFDESYCAPYPSEAPFDIKGLSNLYTSATSKGKVDEAFKEAAREATADLQKGRPGYMAVWQHIVNVSKEDLRKNYHALNVDFDLWLGESDAQQYVPKVLEILASKDLLVESEGAQVVIVEEETDTKSMPPCIMVKGNGAALYGTTDVATIYQRVEKEAVDEIVYVVDKRQGLHFEQVFRVAKKMGLVTDVPKLNFIGFGTMNGKDGKPFKTREGGVMALEDLIGILRDSVKDKLRTTNQQFTDKDIEEISMKVGLAALKFADLSNQAERDYIFDIESFTNFEGKTGPYIQYAIVRMNSILEKAGVAHDSTLNIQPAYNESELALHKLLSKFDQVVESAALDRLPHRVCEYAYQVSQAFNRFYHENPIISESDETKKASWLQLLGYSRSILVTCLDLLGIPVIEKM